jgi:sortase A
VTRIVERVLFVAGILALSWYAIAHVAAAREQAALSRELEAARAAAADEPHTPSAAAPARLEPRALVGRIEVPRIKLSAVAREGVDVRTLRGSIGHVPGTSLPGDPGNAAFAAHRDTFFSPLKFIRDGDQIVITTRDGVHRYAVTGTRIVDPADVSVLQPLPGRHQTLITCYPFDYVGSAPKRFIVQAELQS